MTKEEAATNLVQLYGAYTRHNKIGDRGYAEAIAMAVRALGGGDALDEEARAEANM